MDNNDQNLTTGKIDPDLAAALVAAHAEVESLHRDGSGQHGKYTSSDEVAYQVRRVLTEHGAAWLRLEVDLAPAALDSCELGNQAYVGDVIERCIILHKNGSFVMGSTRMPVIASKGRPHDKAVGASLTYDAGHTLRGLMCLDREDKNLAVDRREDVDDGAPQPVRLPRPPVPQQAAPSLDDQRKENLAKLRASVASRIERFATLNEMKREQAWSDACAIAGYDRPQGNGKGWNGCGFDQLGKINAALKKALGDEARSDA